MVIWCDMWQHLADSHRRPRCMERATLAVDTSLVATFSISCRGIATSDQNTGLKEFVCDLWAAYGGATTNSVNMWISPALFGNNSQYWSILPFASKNSEPDWSTEQLPIAASTLLVVLDCHSKPRPSCSSPWHAATASFARFRAWSESKLWGHSPSNLLKIQEWFSDRLIQMETSWFLMHVEKRCNRLQQYPKTVVETRSCRQMNLGSNVLQYLAVICGDAWSLALRGLPLYYILVSKTLFHCEDPDSETHLKILKSLKCEDYGHDTLWQCAQCHGNQTYPAKIGVHFDAPLWSSLPSRPTPSSLGRRWPWKRMKAINCSAKSKNHFLH